MQTSYGRRRQNPLPRVPHAADEYMYKSLMWTDNIRVKATSPIAGLGNWDARRDVRSSLPQVRTGTLQTAACSGAGPPAPPAPSSRSPPPSSTLTLACPMPPALLLVRILHVDILRSIAPPVSNLRFLRYFLLVTSPRSSITGTRRTAALHA